MTMKPLDCESDAYPQLVIRPSIKYLVNAQRRVCAFMLCVSNDINSHYLLLISCIMYVCRKRWK